MNKKVKDYLKMGREGFYTPSVSMLKVPFQQTWKFREYLSVEGNQPDIHTYLYIAKCHIYTSKYFEFKSAGINIFGREPFLVPYYLWISPDNINHCLDLSETPICISPLIRWKIQIDTDAEIIQKVEVSGYATITKKD